MRNCFIVQVAVLPSMICYHESIIHGLCGVEFDYHVRNVVAMNLFIHGLCGVNVDCRAGDAMYEAMCSLSPHSLPFE